MGTHSSESVDRKTESGEPEESYGIDLQMIFVVIILSFASSLVQHVDGQASGSASHGFRRGRGERWLGP